MSGSSTQQVPPRAGVAGGHDGGWTVARVRALGVTTDVETAGAVLGIGRTKAYELAKAGQFPVKVIRVGRRYRVSVPELLRMVGADEPAPGPGGGRDVGGR